MFAARGKVVCTGVGKSGHVARKIAATLASTGTPALFMHAAEASHGDLGMVGPDDALLALSKSGEARELADIVAHAKRFAIPLIGMTCSASSALGRAADILLLIPDAAEATEGLNAATGEYGDLVEAGVVDPTKVTRTALQNAASVAGLLLTTDAAVCELPKEDAPMPGGMPGGMGGMGMDM